MPTPASIDSRMMRLCLELAARGAGMVSPNPMVGAVLARNGRVLARGYHRVFGGPHAEVNCLRRYRGSVRGATLYVSLEPCAHHGKTPPCVDLILERRIPRVVIAMKDPNPLVGGRGIRRLRRAGVRVEVGLLAREARELNRAFLTVVERGRPYVHVKAALSLDGRIAAREGEQSWISSPESRDVVHGWRATHDAVLIGAGTVLADNPLLTVRTGAGRDPDVVILDGALRSPLNARAFQETERRRVFVITDRASLRREATHAHLLSLAGVMVVGLSGRNGVIPLGRVLSFLREQNIGSLLVEGGSMVFRQFVTAGLIDEMSLFVAPLLMGGGVPAFPPDPARAMRAVMLRATKLESRMVGPDVLMHAQFTPAPAVHPIP
jgi:diaminohydroxyphosphoribosylaminopyrimidine deaminase/5-amino-6-(5-phosphoribosylamino)uracil reductase